MEFITTNWSTAIEYVRRIPITLLSTPPSPIPCPLTSILHTWIGAFANKIPIQYTYTYKMVIEFIIIILQENTRRQCNITQRMQLQQQHRGKISSQSFYRAFSHTFWVEFIFDGCLMEMQDKRLDRMRKRWNSLGDMLGMHGDVHVHSCETIIYIHK